MKYFYEDRLRVVKMYESGKTYTEIIKQLKVPKPELIVWVHRYQKYGEDGLINLPYSKFSFEEKCKIVREHLVESVSLTDLRVKYGMEKQPLIVGADLLNHKDIWHLMIFKSEGDLQKIWEGLRKRSQRK